MSSRFFVIFVSSLRSKLLAPQHPRRGRPPSSFVAMRNARRRDGPRPHKIIEVVPSFDGEPTAAGAPPKRPHATPPVEPEEEPALAVFDAEAAAVDAAAVSSDEDEPTAVDGETVDDEPTAVGRVRLPVASECEAHPRKAALSPSTPSTKDAEVARRVVEVVGASQSKDVASIGLFEGSLDVEMAPKEDLHILSRPAGYEEEFMVKRAWNLMSTSEQYNYAYNKIRGFYVKYVHALRLDSEEEREAFLAMPARQRQAEGRVAFSNLEKGRSGSLHAAMAGRRAAALLVAVFLQAAHDRGRGVGAPFQAKRCALDVAVARQWPQCFGHPGREPTALCRFPGGSGVQTTQ